jgi:hypothetical protein
MVLRTFPEEFFRDIKDKNCGRPVHSLEKSELGRETRRASCRTGPSGGLAFSLGLNDCGQGNFSNDFAFDRGARMLLEARPKLHWHTKTGEPAVFWLAIHGVQAPLLLGALVLKAFT